jgi:hypothetical protein
MGPMSRAFIILLCTLLPAGVWAVSNNAAAPLEVPDPPMNTSGSFSGNLLAQDAEFLTPGGVQSTMPERDPLSALPPIFSPIVPPLMPAALPEMAITPALPAVAIEPAAGPASPLPDVGLFMEAPEVPTPTVIPATPQYVPNEVSAAKPQATVVTKPGYVPTAAPISKTVVVPAKPVRKLIPAPDAELKPMLGPDGNYYTPAPVNFLDAPLRRMEPQASDAPLVPMVR